MHSIIPLDLNFLSKKNAVASYLVPYEGGAALVETGPGSTIEELKNKLKEHELKPENVTHVFLTHIHLDHAGASGWLVTQGAQIFVHPFGAPHMEFPEKLLSSAKRIYKDKMDYLWGEFLPVPSEKLTSVGDGEMVKVGNLSFTAIHTPGHAGHHISWLLEDTCFTGDVGGIRIPGVFYIRMPLVPPELDFEKWRNSLTKLKEIGFNKIAPTHFGIYSDADAHLSMALQLLDENEQWMEHASIDDTPIEVLREQYATFLHDQGIKLGVSEATLQISEVANPPRMGADGIQRYWNKYRHSNKM